VHFFTKLDLGCAGYGVLLAAEECSDTIIAHPMHTPLHIRGQLILIMFRCSMQINVVNITLSCAIIKYSESPTTIDMHFWEFLFSYCMIYKKQNAVLYGQGGVA